MFKFAVTSAHGKNAIAVFDTQEQALQFVASAEEQDRADGCYAEKAYKVKRAYSDDPIIADFYTPRKKAVRKPAKQTAQVVTASPVAVREVPNRSSASREEILEAIWNIIPQYPRTIRLHEIDTALKLQGYSGYALYSYITVMTYMYNRYPICEDSETDKYTGRHHSLISKLSDDQKKSQWNMSLDELKNYISTNGLLKRN